MYIWETLLQRIISLMKPLEIAQPISSSIPLVFNIIPISTLLINFTSYIWFEVQAQIQTNDNPRGNFKMTSPQGKLRGLPEIMTKSGKCGEGTQYSNITNSVFILIIYFIFIYLITFILIKNNSFCLLYQLSHVLMSMKNW